MKSEYAANLSMQTKHTGKSLVAKSQEKYGTINHMLASYATKFAALITAVSIVKHFI